MERELIFKARREDFRVDTFRSGGKGGQNLGARAQEAERQWRRELRTQNRRARTSGQRLTNGDRAKERRESADSASAWRRWACENEPSA